MFHKVRIRSYEVGLWFRHGDFHHLLHAGSYWIPGLWTGIDSILVVNKLTPEFEHPRLDVLVTEPELREQLEVVDLAENQRALIWKDGRLVAIKASGRFAFWNKPGELKVEVFDARQPRFEHSQIDAILAFPGSSEHFQAVDVPINERLLIFVHGELFDTVGADRHVFWKAAGIDWQAIDLREQTLDVSGQEILTADRVTLRINLVAVFRVTDPVLAALEVTDFRQALYRDAQLALRVAIGGRSLDDLLGDKEAVGLEIREVIAERATTFGVRVDKVGLRDIILPGEMKAILNRVIEAKKQAEANLILRREETAAARSQANTARLLADNPGLARMKELEALQEILRGTTTTFVLGQGELGQQIRSLVAGDKPSA